jgi:uncharacterized protein YbaR (Trm112 family)
MPEQKVDEKLLAILVCPVDKEPVKQDGDFLVCGACKRKYPIREGIPVMLVDEAVTDES